MWNKRLLLSLVLSLGCVADQEEPDEDEERPTAPGIAAARDAPVADDEARPTPVTAPATQPAPTLPLLLQGKYEYVNGWSNGAGAAVPIAYRYWFTYFAYDRCKTITVAAPGAYGVRRTMQSGTFSISGGTLRLTSDEGSEALSFSYDSARDVLRIDGLEYRRMTTNKPLCD